MFEELDERTPVGPPTQAQWAAVRVRGDQIRRRRRALRAALPSVVAVVVVAAVVTTLVGRVDRAAPVPPAQPAPRPAPSVSASLGATPRPSASASATPSPHVTASPPSTTAPGVVAGPGGSSVTPVPDQQVLVVQSPAGGPTTLVSATGAALAVLPTAPDQATVGSGWSAASGVLRGGRLLLRSNRAGTAVAALAATGQTTRVSPALVPLLTGRTTRHVAALVTVGLHNTLALIVTRPPAGPTTSVLARVDLTAGTVSRPLVTFSAARSSATPPDLASVAGTSADLRTVYLVVAAGVGDNGHVLAAPEELRVGVDDGSVARAALPAVCTPAASAVSPSGQWVACAAATGALTLLDTTSGQSHPLSPQPGPPLAPLPGASGLSFSANGEYLADVGLDGSAPLLQVYSVGFAAHPMQDQQSLPPQSLDTQAPVLWLGDATLVFLNPVAGSLSAQVVGLLPGGAPVPLPGDGVPAAVLAP